MKTTRLGTRSFLAHERNRIGRYPGWRLFAAVALMVGTASLDAGELDGVQLADTIQESGHQLVLNGMGLRTRFIFDVYVAGLYLTARETDANAIVEADQPKYLEMRMLRSVARDSLNSAWEDCLNSNTRAPSEQQRNAFKQLKDWMENVEEKDSMSFRYIPASGTQVKVRGVEKGSIAGKPFANALFRCWLGPNPPSRELQDGLLGKS